jgi:hypothetical protein
MISIFIGYVSVIVVFYLGKMDEHEREFLHVLNNVRIYEEELFTSIHRLYPKLGSKPHQTRIEAFRTAMEQMRSDPIYTEENRNGLIEESKEFAFSLFVGVFFR